MADPANLANVLGALASMVNDRVTHAVVSPELSLADVTAISLVHTYPGCSIAELRDPLMLSHSGCVRLVDRLVGGGYVERRAGRDGRAVALWLTPRGHDVATAGTERRGAALLLALSALDPEERHALARIATKLLVYGVPTPQQAGRTCRLCDHEVCVECPFHAMAAAYAATPHDPEGP